MRLPVVATFLSIVALVAGQSSSRCFITNDWGHIVPGEPHVLIWDAGSFWDVLLNANVHTKAVLAGVVARNISQNSVVWIPPRDIARDENQVFAIQLWDLARGTGCVSPAFRFAQPEDKDDNGPGETATLPPGPFVTTAVSLISFGSITATATVASFQNDKSASEHTVTGSITGTDTAIVTSTNIPSADSPPAGVNVLAIAIGTVGSLLLIIVVLSVLLWRSRRKRARQRANSTAGAKLIPSSTDSKPPSVIEMDARQVAAAEMPAVSSRYEMEAGSVPAELPSLGMAPVELPADEVPLPRYPGGRAMSVSSLGESRRSSMDRGVGLVSPASDLKS